MINIALSDLIYRNKVTKTELAAFLDVSRSTLDGYLNGTRPMPSDKIVLAAQYFNVSVGYLFGETDSSTSLQDLQCQMSDLAKKIENIANILQMK